MIHLLSCRLSITRSIRFTAVYKLLSMFQIPLPFQLHVEESLTCVTVNRAKSAKGRQLIQNRSECEYGWMKSLCFLGFCVLLNASCNSWVWKLYEVTTGVTGNWKSIFSTCSSVQFWPNGCLSFLVGLSNQSVCWRVCDHFSKSLSQWLQSGFQFCWSCELLHCWLGMFQKQYFIECAVPKLFLADVHL